MAQQINLFSPILLQPKRYFSAWAMTQAFAALAVGLAALALWAQYSTAQLHKELATTTAAQLADRQRLQAELGRHVNTATDTRALEQEVNQARQIRDDRARLLGDWSRQVSGGSRADVLRLLAQTAPDKLWLTEVRLADGRLDLAGMTLQPEQLRPWLGHLLRQPLLQGLSLRQVSVEAADSAAQQQPSWSFRISAQAATAEPAPVRTGREQLP